MAMTCDKCGATSEFYEAYIHERSSFRTKSRTYCPACALERQASWRPLFLGWGALLLCGFVVVLLDPSDGWFVLNLFIATLCSFLLIIPHELGHAIVAKLLGMHILKIILGRGRLLWTGTILGFPCEFRQLPVVGVVLTLQKSANWFRLKRFCTLAAGPMVNLCLLLLVLKVPREQGLMESLTTSVSPIGWLVLANAWALFANLFPSYLTGPPQKIPNDGLALLKTPTISRQVVENWMPLYYAYRGSELLAKDRDEEARAIIDEGLQKYPQDSTLKLNFGVVLMSEHAAEEARNVFAKLLEEDDGEDRRRHALLQNNLAYAQIVCDPSQYLREADELSQQAFGTLPWVPEFRVTRGMVLIESDQADEGIALLLEAGDKKEELRKSASYMSYLAIAEMRRGNQEKAREYLAKAKQKDDTCMLIGRAEKELERRSAEGGAEAGTGDR